MSPRLIVAVLALCLSISWAEDPAPAKPTKANASRLGYKEDGLAYLHKRGSAELSETPFTGIAFWEGDNWRAEVPFVKGVKHGEVFVIVNNKVFSRFRYDQGRKIVDE